jgi:hypothetical protein
MRIPTVASVVLAAGILGAGLLGTSVGEAFDAADLGFATHDDPDPGQAPPVVLAHIDTGINPYHEAFQTDDPRATQHPSTYLDGYPAPAEALPLTLGVGSVEEGLDVDADLWSNLDNDTLYWVPGTRIVALKHVGPGGTSCSATPVPPANLVGGDCEDHRLLDDHGHGTMTASRMAGKNSSLGEDAFIASVEGLGAESVRWTAKQEWIDVQSNSWVSFTPPPANQAQDDVDEPDSPLPPITGNSSTTDAFRQAAQDQFVAAASGNGAAYTQGVAPTPTYVLSTAAPNVTLVGAHDNGYVAPWSGAPAHLVADGYAGPVASHTDNDAWGPSPVACCTSAAAPYAAGAAGALIQEARTVLDHDTPGIRDGVVARGDPADAPQVGPLADGIFTLDELRTLLYHTADARPTEGAHDGLAHWGSGDRAPGDWAETYGPGANPFCQGCTTSPVPWRNVSEEAPAYHDIGYGSVDPGTVTTAQSVLHGHRDAPTRPVVDDWFRQDQALRETLTQDVASISMPTS